MKSVYLARKPKILLTTKIKYAALDYDAGGYEMRLTSTAHQNLRNAISEFRQIYPLKGCVITGAVSGIITKIPLEGFELFERDVISLFLNSDNWEGRFSYVPLEDEVAATADNHKEASMTVETKTAEQFIKEDYVRSWHHPQEDLSFELSDLDGQMSAHRPYDNDRDNKPMCNGQVKFFRDEYGSGKVRKGKIYHNINNMWWVITDPMTVRNVASFHLFDDTLRQKVVRWIPRIKISVSFGKAS